MIDVEGTKFRVLLGTSPEEVEIWRAERRKRWPTDANMARLVGRSRLQAPLYGAGGGGHEVGSHIWANRHARAEKHRAEGWNLPYAQKSSRSGCVVKSCLGWGARVSPFFVSRLAQEQ